MKIFWFGVRSGQKDQFSLSDLFSFSDPTFITPCFHVFVIHLEDAVGFSAYLRPSESCVSWNPHKLHLFVSYLLAANSYKPPLAPICFSIVLSFCEIVRLLLLLICCCCKAENPCWRFCLTCWYCCDLFWYLLLSTRWLWCCNNMLLLDLSPKLKSSKALRMFFLSRFSDPRLVALVTVVLIRCCWLLYLPLTAALSRDKLCTCCVLVNIEIGILCDGL